jgi:predicted TIM-barrel fold metal-dependent hydrolase
MDKAGISMQVLSLTLPNCESYPKDVGIRLAKINNDYISRLIHDHPNRFAGQGALTLQDVEE